MNTTNLTENVLMIFRQIANALESIANRKKHIDWEQRRYEVAKDVFLSFIKDGGFNENYPQAAFDYADCLILHMRREREEDEA